ncbi:hypothetical protein ACUNV4_14675 [Granulosicoccus sp. 3-233]|uniref:hypothetical protein n=1 Tax=Granulosicoccus sp. 3-233 TaxID=3417969 RepID=UPI003D3492AA
MRLLFLLQKEAWFVEHQQAWYRLEDMNEVGLALSGLALNMVNQHELIEQPHQAGTARVTQADDRRLSVQLSSPDHQIIATVDVVLDENTLLNVDWNTKPYRDGWVSSDATITLDNVGAMYLDAYLPARSDSDGKMLTISNQVTGNSLEVWVARDQKTRIPLVQNGSKGKVSLNLHCEPELIDQTTDPRQLGFVMISEEASPV